MDLRLGDFVGQSTKNTAYAVSSPRFRKHKGPTHQITRILKRGAGERDEVLTRRRWESHGVLRGVARNDRDQSGGGWRKSSAASRCFRCQFSVWKSYPLISIHDPKVAHIDGPEGNLEGNPWWMSRVVALNHWSLQHCLASSLQLHVSPRQSDLDSEVQDHRSSSVEFGSIRVARLVFWES